MPEQVLAGWMIYPAEWNEDRKPDRNAKKESQKMSLIESLYAGRLLKIFPYKAQDGLKWFSQGDNLPDKMPVDVWTFVRKSPDYLQETILKGKIQRCQQDITENKKISTKDSRQQHYHQNKVHCRKDLQCMEQHSPAVDNMHHNWLHPLHILPIQYNQ
jgi:hypothetical protein